MGTTLPAPGGAFGILTLALLAGCTGTPDAPLSKKASNEIPKVPVPAEHGPKLASIADLTPVLERPARDARRIGYLHAGARVSRAEKPYSREDCAQGFYPVRPAGFVCAEGSATVDLTHPTLAAMAIQPLLDQPLPYTYARTSGETPLFERDPARDGAVREVGKLRRRAGVAVVGSWSATVPGSTEAERLALLTSGRFAKARDLEAAKPSEFAGVELRGKVALPLAFVVKRGVRRYKLDRENAEKDKELDYHALLPLTGRFRTAHGEKFWALDAEKWVRNRDVTAILPRSTFPDFAVEGQKWLDVSLVMQTLVAYEGKKAFFATLVSVGREVAPAADTSVSDAVQGMPSAAWGLGTFEISAKHVTEVGADPFSLRESHQVYDVPWTLELASGRKLYGAYWHDRFGIEHGAGGIELSPGDAVRIFQWATPALPDGWHSSTRLGSEAKTLVVLRK
jgi:hypothetical protein